MKEFIGNIMALIGYFFQHLLLQEKIIKAETAMNIDFEIIMFREISRACQENVINEQARWKVSHMICTYLFEVKGRSKAGLEVTAIFKLLDTPEGTQVGIMPGTECTNFHIDPECFTNPYVELANKVLNTEKVRNDLIEYNLKHL